MQLSDEIAIGVRDEEGCLTDAVRARAFSYLTLKGRITTPVWEEALRFATAQMRQESAQRRREAAE